MPEHAIPQATQNSDDQRNQNQSTDQVPMHHVSSSVDPDQEQSSSDITDAVNSPIANSASPGRWQSLVDTVKLICGIPVISAMISFIVLMSLLDNHAKKEGLGRHRRQRLPEEETETRLLPHSTDRTESPDSTFPAPRSILRNVVARLPSSGRVLLPLSGWALRTVLIVGPSQRPNRDSGTCSGRQTDIGFVGNADFYGLGVRTGLYLQWVAAILAIRFLPSARKLVQASYLFYHFGMIVAMCLLILPGSCSFVAELSLVFQILWTGGALALVPSQSPGTEMNLESQYFVIDLISLVVSLGVDAAAFYFYLNTYYLHRDENYVDTTSDARQSGGWLRLLAYIPGLWIGKQSVELYNKWHQTKRAHLFSEILEWNWHTSANLATMSWVWLMNTVMIMSFYLTPFIDIFASLVLAVVFGTLKSDEDSDHDGTGFQTFNLMQNYSKFTRQWYGMLRDLFILTVSVLRIESMIGRNEISGVQSLDSTGQVMPLAIGIVTVTSLIYLWIKEFLSRARKASTEDATSTTPEQAIGMSTSSGRWR